MSKENKKLYGNALKMSDLHSLASSSSFLVSQFSNRKSQITEELTRSWNTLIGHNKILVAEEFYLYLIKDNAEVPEVCETYKMIIKVKGSEASSVLSYMKDQILHTANEILGDAIITAVSVGIDYAKKPKNI